MASSGQSVVDPRGEATYDAVIVGGAFAGLSAALVLGRARRRVLVCDGGPPRNAIAHASHGFFGSDGTPPLDLLQRAREELQPYDSVEVRSAVVESAGALDPSEGVGFRLTLAGGEAVRGRLVLLAYGLVDVLPEVPGLADLWGRAVHHCPYCHGWEVRDRQLGVLGSWRTARMRVSLLRGWSTDLTAFLQDAETEGQRSADAAAEIERLTRLGVAVRTEPLTHVEPSGESGIRVVLEGGDALDLGGLFVAPAQAPRIDLAGMLDCIPQEGAEGFLPFIRVSEAGETTTPGVYAAGDLIGYSQSVAMAVGSGARAAYQMNHRLAHEAAEALLAE